MKKLFHFLCCALIVFACNEKGGQQQPGGFFWPDGNDYRASTDNTVPVFRDMGSYHKKGDAAIANLTGFYNLDRLSEVMNEYYK